MSIESISRPGATVHLLGTAHVSRNSVEEVENAISELKPDVVAIELCPGRFESMQNRAKWQEMDIVKVIKEKKAGILLANMVLTSFQRRIGSQMGVTPGQEMQAAIARAEAEGCRLELIDRPIQATLQRAWGQLTFKEKNKILWRVLISIFAAEDFEEEDIERLKEQDVLTAAIDEIGRAVPTVKRVLIDERDSYMAAKLQAVEGNVLAVIGAGHGEGIRRKLNEAPADLEELEKIPAKKNSLGKWILPMLILGIVVGGFFMGGTDKGVALIKWWFIITALGAALGSAAALAHPVSILVSAIASPITTLNPALAAGWFAGLAEAYLRKPKVADFENLLSDLESVKGFWRNPIMRTLLVVAFANLGATIGSLVAMPILAKLMVAG